MENTKVSFEELRHLYDVKEIFEMVKRFNLDEFYQHF
jgi:hypothetical protein